MRLAIMLAGRTFLAVVIVLWGNLPSAYAQDRFYLTVERSFAPNEAVKVRLDFVNQHVPLVLRVLRPKSVESFLDGQLNLSRSYELPLTDLNGGHYLLRGMNEVRSPLVLLRRLLSVDFRDGFGGADFKSALRAEAYPRELVTAPRELSIGAPAGFEIVREHFIDLQGGGDIPKGLYGNWGWPPSDDYRFKVREIAIDPVPDGIYLLQGVQNRSEAQALLQVSAITTQVKQSSNQLLVRVLDRAGKPVSGATVALRDGRGVWQPLSTDTDIGGQVFYEADDMLDTRLVVLVKDKAGNQAIADTDFLPAENHDNAVFMLTDRPIFKPGETFFFKGIARSREKGRLLVPVLRSPEGRAFFERVGSAAGSASDEATVKFGEGGTFSGSFTLPDAQPPGLYRVVTTLDGKPYAGELRVRDYVKPKFYLELLGRDDSMRLGQPFHFSFSAKPFSGGRPRGVKYETFIYRKKFESPQWVEEAGGGLQTEHDYYGETRSASQLATPQRIYSSTEERLKARGELDWGSSWLSAPEVDDTGRAEVTITMPAVAEDEDDWIYTLVVRALDKSGASAVLSENLYMTLSEAMPAASFEKAFAEPTEKAVVLKVRASLPDDRPASGVSGQAIFLFEDTDGTKHDLPRISFVTDASGAARMDVPLPGERGRLVAECLLESREGRNFRRASRSKPASIVLGGADGEAVLRVKRLELYPEKTTLVPGEAVRTLALLPDSRIGTVMWQSIASEKILEHANLNVTGHSHWLAVDAKPDYGSGFFQTVTIPKFGGGFDEQTVGYRIIPRDKQLQVQISPSEEVAAPLAPFSLAVRVTDYRGQGAAGVELAIGVVDRAVYTVAPEFRPGIVDFFYPLPRLNLATFYSDELQGYGYADEIRKPNFSLTALKSANKPVKRSMRDTAGWFPHVLTDAAGNASVTLDMPANLTEWLVTAVASDTLGRVGEGRGRFRSASDVGVELRLPSYIREGDDIMGAIEAANQTASPVSLSINATASPGLVLNDIHGGNSELPAGGVSTVALHVASARASDKDAATISVEALAPSARVGGARIFDLDILPDRVSQVLTAKVDGLGLRFDTPPSSVMRELRVSVFSGLTGAALSAAQSLVSYPYGCVEQLLHTTLPNMVLLDVVQQAGLSETQQGSLKLNRALEQARRYANSALARLAGYQQSDGGFGLWPSDKEASFGITALAARALALAAVLKLDRAESLSAKAQGWLVKNISTFTALPRGPLKAYLVSLLSEAEVYSPFDDSVIAYVREVVDAPETAGIDEVIAALRVLTMRERHYWFLEKLDRPHAKELLGSSLIARLAMLDESAVARVASLSLAPHFGFSYGQAGIIARMLAALHEAKLLDKPTRQKFVARLLRLYGPNAWGSTFDNGEVILALRNLVKDELAAMSEKDERSAPVVSTSRGETLGSLERLPGAFVGRFKEASPLSFHAAIRVSGALSSDIQKAELEVEVPYKELAEKHQGIKVSRTFFVLTPGGARELRGGEPLAPGDVVVSRVEVKRDPEYSFAVGASSLVVVEDGVPALAEAIDEDRNYLADAQFAKEEDTFWSSVKDTMRHPDRTVRVMDVNPGGSRVFYQVWRAHFSGTASIPPARAFDMYHEEISGNSGPAFVSVR